MLWPKGVNSHPFSLAGGVVALNGAVGPRTAGAEGHAAEVSHAGLRGPGLVSGEESKPNTSRSRAVGLTKPSGRDTGIPPPLPAGGAGGGGGGGGTFAGGGGVLAAAAAVGELLAV